MLERDYHGRWGIKVQWFKCSLLFSPVGPLTAASVLTYFGVCASPGTKVIVLL